MSENQLVRSMVRGSYAIQKLRIQIGNRVTTNFKSKLGMNSDGMSEDDLDKQSKDLLKKLRASYDRITDAIVTEGSGDIITAGKLPSSKKFVGDELISTFAELVLVDQYVSILREEESSMSKLPKVLDGIPIYDEYLSKVSGIGPQMAAVIISEIDIHKAEYPSSLCKYAGLDVVIVGEYTNDKGIKKTIRAEDIDLWLENNDPDETTMLAEGKYPVTFNGIGRNRRDYSLVKRAYIDKDGKESIRDSISFNPFLKTKLIGVLGGSFLKGGRIYVDDEMAGSIKRIEIAKADGFDIKSVPKSELNDAILEYLKQTHDVRIEYTEFGKIYYDYKWRLQNSPFHKEKTDLHRHNMAIRYTVKRFLSVLYSVWRKLEGLPVAEEYAVAKLGIHHGVASEAKNRLVQHMYGNRQQAI